MVMEKGKEREVLRVYRVQEDEELEEWWYHEKILDTAEYLLGQGDKKIIITVEDDQATVEGYER